MARTPKAASIPAPSPLGRKPKAAVPERAAAAGSGAAGVEATPAAAAPAMDDAPTRSQPGRKLKGRDAAAAASALQDDAGQQPRPDMDQPDAAAEPVASGEDALIAEMAYPVSAGESGEAPASDSSPPPIQDAAPPARSAAQWDRAADTVRFDWAEIERTALQDGPNQVMAKLLVAARAEGANSRWPL